MSYQQDSYPERNIETIKHRLATETNSPAWTDEDREALETIKSLSDLDLATAMLNRDPRTRLTIGNFSNPTICGYCKHYRPEAVRLYREMFYSKR